jgi:hypothetical protein
MSVGLTGARCLRPGVICLTCWDISLLPGNYWIERDSEAVGPLLTQVAVCKYRQEFLHLPGHLASNNHRAGNSGRE